MRLLLDTHFAIWLTTDSEQMGATDRAFLKRAPGRLVLSTVALWEVRLKWHSLHKSGERKGEVSPETVLQFAGAAGWEILKLEPAHAVTALSQAMPHKDPFDELLLVQAQVEGIKLFTRDDQLIGHPLTLTP